MIEFMTPTGAGHMQPRFRLGEAFYQLNGSPGYVRQHIIVIFPDNPVHGELPVTQRLRSAVLVECTFSERNSGFQHG
jgi:hypothetical protein